MVQMYPIAPLYPSARLYKWSLGYVRTISVLGTLIQMVFWIHLDRLWFGSLGYIWTDLNSWIGEPGETGNRRGLKIGEQGVTGTGKNSKMGNQGEPGTSFGLKSGEPCGTGNQLCFISCQPLLKTAFLVTENCHNLKPKFYASCEKRCWLR